MRKVAKMMGVSTCAISKLAKQASEMGETEAPSTQKERGRKCLASPLAVRRAIKIMNDKPFLSAKGVKALMGPQGAKFSVRRIRELLRELDMGPGTPPRSLSSQSR